MSWRKYNKIYTEGFKVFNVWYLKAAHPEIKKLRARNWLKANQRRGIKNEFKSNY